jgi:hypothetical protein
VKGTAAEQPPFAVQYYAPTPSTNAAGWPGKFPGGVAEATTDEIDRIAHVACYAYEHNRGPDVWRAVARAVLKVRG